MRTFLPSKGFSILAGLALLVILIKMFLFSPYMVHGQSMSPSLKGEERIIVNKWTYYFATPSYGDIIVFRTDENRNMIKRVIGLPGDVVSIESGYVFRNGERLDEPYLDKRVRGFLERTEVTEGHLFVLGDNRNNSLDSRQLGLIPMDRVVGRADLILTPLDEMGVLVP
ncbi:signal peptidase I [Paludifilum halophilum]|uniref:Signal peptidase I n=1 Tax=Paludifilum halophilum TaxID=1642702 RepID=A0A235B865_9BACL|nr:signal peptidase I [Paludifilum halophilum]OYD08476.1 signal peptidase I [Paludifilum halophilum]